LSLVYRVRGSNEFTLVPEKLFSSSVMWQLEVGFLSLRSLY
jgi:hypothetical protein